MSQENKTCKLCEKVKNIKWNKKIDSVVGFALFGGAVVLAVAIGIICCLI